MSRRRELELRLRKLTEIGEIMRSMKNLALIETRKLARFLEAQEQSVIFFETVASDFLHFFPQYHPKAESEKHAFLLIGSERGFCGDFNEELSREFDLVSCGTDPVILAVGGKLRARLERYPTLDDFEGPSVAEDVPAALNRLVPAISRKQHDNVFNRLTVLLHRSGADGVSKKTLLPPFDQVQEPSASLRHPPILNVPPERFFADLVRHYLFAALHEIFYTSLMAENERRVQHLEGAIQRLEEKNAALERQSRILRQEEITEEIEVILLSAEGATQKSTPSGPAP